MTAAASPAQAEPIAPAIIYVDGQEFIRCEEGDNFRALFDDTVREVGGEVALMVWKPRYGIYLRERLSIAAHGPLGRLMADATARAESRTS